MTVSKLRHFMSIDVSLSVASYCCYNAGIFTLLVLQHKHVPSLSTHWNSHTNSEFEELYGGLIGRNVREGCMPGDVFHIAPNKMNCNPVKPNIRYMADIRTEYVLNGKWRLIACFLSSFLPLSLFLSLFLLFLFLLFFFLSFVLTFFSLFLSLAL
jgi:hypothetical protein